MSRWSKIGMVLMTGGLVAGMAGCGNSQTETQTEKVTDAGTSKTTDTAAEVTEAGRTKLIVGFDAEYPPYGYMDDSGEYVGFDLDLAQEVCDRNGWELVKQPIDWDSKDMELNSGSID